MIFVSSAPMASNQSCGWTMEHFIASFSPSWIESLNCPLPSETPWRRRSA
jgi:hypothetical protein